ncbi:MAG: MarR family transcriptional regulator [Bacteroidales bacterium]|nr:MarR family transcriptional regulator [Bacteroidales bacterium]
MDYEQLKLDNQLCFRLYTAARLTTGAYHPYLAPLGITYSQYLVLLVLWENGSLPVNDIARRLMLETNTITPLLQRLEKASLLKRTKGKVDSRQRIVSLTKKGTALREQAKHIPECLSAEIVKKLGSADDIVQMVPVLDRLIDGLKQTENK